MLAEIDGAAVELKDVLLEDKAGVGFQRAKVFSPHNHTQLLVGINFQAQGEAAAEPDSRQASCANGALELGVLFRALDPVNDPGLAAALEHGQGADIGLRHVRTEVPEFAADLRARLKIRVTDGLGDLQGRIAVHGRGHAGDAGVAARGVLVAQAMGCHAQGGAGHADHAELVVEVVFALQQGSALFGQGALPVAGGIELGALDHVSLPLAHGRIVLKAHVARQAALGAVNDAQDMALIGRCRVELDGLFHPEAKCGLYFKLDGGQGAAPLQLFQHLVQIHIVLVPGQALGGHRMPPVGHLDTLAVEPGAQVMALWNDVFLSYEGQEPPQNGYLVLNGAAALPLGEPVPDESQDVGFADLAEVAHGCAVGAQVVDHADHAVAVGAAGALGHGALAAGTGFDDKFAEEHGELGLGVVRVAFLDPGQDAHGRACRVAGRFLPALDVLRLFADAPVDLARCELPAAGAQLIASKVQRNRSVVGAQVSQFVPHLASFRVSGVSSTVHRQIRSGPAHGRGLRAGQ